MIRAWEVGGSLPPIERGLSLLGMVLPGADGTDLAQLTLGQGDALLLRGYERTFGPLLHVLEDCPSCGESLEFDVAVTELLAAEEANTESDTRAFTCHDHELRIRVPTLSDLAAAARLVRETGDAPAARVELIERCVQTARCNGEAVAARDLPDVVVAALCERLEQCDPLAELRFELSCPECANAWSAWLDVGGFFWKTVSTRARTLLGEVHVLARAYGWAESDILAMSPVRRRHYLDVVASSY